ncbi:MAG: hypothetical protein U1E65_09850 [Myxococcota bacterium]
MRRAWILLCLLPSCSLDSGAFHYTLVSAPQTVVVVDLPSGAGGLSSAIALSLPAGEGSISVPPSRGQRAVLEYGCDLASLRLVEGPLALASEGTGKRGLPPTSTISVLNAGIPSPAPFSAVEAVHLDVPDDVCPALSARQIPMAVGPGVPLASAWLRGDEALLVFGSSVAASLYAVNPIATRVVASLGPVSRYWVGGGRGDGKAYFYQLGQGFFSADGSGALVAEPSPALDHPGGVSMAFGKDRIYLLSDRAEIQAFTPGSGWVQLAPPSRDNQPTQASRSAITELPDGSLLFNAFTHQGAHRWVNGQILDETVNVIDSNDYLMRLDSEPDGSVLAGSQRGHLLRRDRLGNWTDLDRVGSSMVLFQRLGWLLLYGGEQGVVYRTVVSDLRRCGQEAPVNDTVDIASAVENGMLLFPHLKSGFSPGDYAASFVPLPPLPAGCLQ